MELSRLQKYKNLKKKKLILMSKIIVVFYLVIFSFGYLTGGTVAYFSNSNQGYVKLKAGTWFDGSKLIFIGNNGTVVDQSCPAVEISADFKNVGHKMQGPGKYEVYYTETENKGKGSPENHGTSIFTGEFNALDKEEVITLSFLAENVGFYVFKVHQREGFEGNDKEKEIWSNKFNIQCKEDNGKNKEHSEEQESETEISEEVVDEATQTEEVVEETTSEPAESNTSQQDPAQGQNKENNEQNDNATEDVPEDKENSSEGSTYEGTADTNNQPAGEGETNEETD